MTRPKITFNFRILSDLIDEKGGVPAVTELLKDQTPESYPSPKRQTLYLWRRGETTPSSEILPYLAYVLGCDTIDDLYLFEKVKA